MLNEDLVLSLILDPHPSTMMVALQGIGPFVGYERSAQIWLISTRWRITGKKDIIQKVRGPTLKGDDSFRW